MSKKYYICPLADCSEKGTCAHAKPHIPDDIGDNCLEESCASVYCVPYIKPLQLEDELFEL